MFPRWVQHQFASLQTREGWKLCKINLQNEYVLSTKLFSSLTNRSQTGSKICCCQEKESDRKYYKFYCFHFKTQYVSFNIYCFFHFSVFHFSNYFVSKFLVKLQTLHWVVNLELSFILWIEKMLQIIVFFKRKSLMGWQQNTFCLQHQAIVEYINGKPFLTSGLAVRKTKEQFLTPNV